MEFYGIISPQEWGLPVSDQSAGSYISRDGNITFGELEQRIRSNVYIWLPQQFNQQVKAFYGFYRATDHFREPPQTVNLIASWELMAAFDRYGDQSLLAQAQQALSFYYEQYTVTHPMSVVRGGALDGVNRNQIWSKFSAEFIIGAIGLYRRTGNPEWLERAVQSGSYLLQAARHGFATKYLIDSNVWISPEFGWDSWGRAIEACLQLEAVTGENAWYHLAMRWGEHALSIQDSNGCFYLINKEFYNTDLAADELRGLFFLHERSGDDRFLNAGLRLAEWHQHHQLPSGAWAMTIDCDGNVVVPTVGPGDVPNIAIALLLAHHLTGRKEFLDTALRAFHYSLTVQVLPESDQPFHDDPAAQWGFWSWDPKYDFTLSGDQATHHVRGMMFWLDYHPAWNSQTPA